MTVHTSLHVHLAVMTRLESTCVHTHVNTTTVSLLADPLCDDSVGRAQCVYDTAHTPARQSCLSVTHCARQVPVHVKHPSWLDSQQTHVTVGTSSADTQLPTPSPPSC